MTMNRLWNCNNPYQGDYKRILCVCSAGLLRSPTTALVLSKEPFNYNTRAAGLEDYALVQVDDVLLNWAHEIVCMDTYQQKRLVAMLYDLGLKTKVLCLHIEDSFAYRDATLINTIKNNYREASNES